MTATSPFSQAAISSCTAGRTIYGLTARRDALAYRLRSYGTAPLRHCGGTLAPCAYRGLPASCFALPGGQRLQPGSSIMLGKVKPVMPEAVAMACVQVIGLDTAVALAAQDNRFQLATMLPLIAFDLLQQLALLTSAARSLEQQAITCFEADVQGLETRAKRNAMLVTALTPRIGYDLASRIARTALEQGRAVIEVARELSGLMEAELADLLDPERMARPHEHPRAPTHKGGGRGA